MTTSAQFKSKPIRRSFLAAACAALMFAALPLLAQDPHALRDVSGTVTDTRREPLKGAVVQLENESTSAIVSYVTGDDGRFEFKRVSANDDFRLSATFRNRRSRHKELSKFSSRTASVIRLVIRPR